MKSVGEVMAIGRTFKQAFMKAMRARELDTAPRPPADDGELLARLERPSDDRYDLLLEALRRGASVDELQRRTNVNPWFLEQFRAVLGRRARFDFDHEVGGLTRVEQAVAFLALLELRRAGEIRLEQAAPFAPIRVSREVVDEEVSWNARSA